MGFFDIFRRKKKDAKADVILSSEDKTEVVTANPENGLAVILEALPTSYEVKETGLVEIKDKALVARIDSLVPTAGSTGTSVRNVIQNAVSSKGETLYRVILKNGGELIDSADMIGAKRAMTKVGNSISEHANLVAVSPTSDTLGTVANAASGVMSVASMVVGQYYMQQVDEKLSSIKAGVLKIVENLEIKYKSRVEELIESVYTLSQFQLSVMANDELRNRELDVLQDLRRDCIKLLNESENNLFAIVSESYANYNLYEAKIEEIGKWIKYRNVLIQVLYQINMLDFTLHLGVKSKKQCFGSFRSHTDKVERIHKELVRWHKEECTLLKIDIEESKRKHTGFWAAVLEKPFSLINDDWNYSQVEEKTISMIKEQSKAAPQLCFEEDSLFVKDVEIITDGKTYKYLPN